MTVPFLSTKLNIPPLRSKHVPRQRLVRKLKLGLGNKLTLISAPAGFGKTTLLSACVQDCLLPIAWLSLDQGDNDPTRFLGYLIAAIQQIDSNIGGGLIVSLQSTQSPGTQYLLMNLLNQIAEKGKSFAVVLDDYHLITEPAVQEILIFCVENLPLNLHLVISSRSDPPWPLARFRVQGEMTEIRSHEMRFTREEATSFLNEVMGLALSHEDIAALESRTEGWIAGLQMAALSMRDRKDKTGFIKAFSGSHRYVIDYLMEEVLEQQTPETQKFLLKTSILERLNGDLCDDIVSDQTIDHRILVTRNSQSILESLEQNNLFLIPLDDQRRWYRYHHLFADLLRNHLNQTHPDDVVGLHQKASLWYERKGLLPDAIRHALAANDIELIVHLTKELPLDTLDYGEFQELMAWLDGLPEKEFSHFPWLFFARALGNFKIGKFERTEKDFEAIENILAKQPKEDEMVIRIRGHIAAIRSYLAEISEDTLSALQQAEDALALLPEKDILLRSYVSIRRANSLTSFGDFNKAIPAYQKTGMNSKKVGDGQYAINSLSEMAIVQMLAGQLKQAIININDTCNYAEELALRDGRRLPAMGILYRHMSYIKREQNELLEADYYANEAVKICRQWGEKEALAFGFLSLARVKFSLGEYIRVDALIQEILHIAGQISPRAVEQFQLWSIYFQLLQGQTEQAQIWAKRLELTAEDEFDFTQHFIYQNFVRLLLCQGDYPAALKIVQSLLKVVNTWGDTIYTIQYQMLQAITLEKLNRLEEAMAATGIALTLARTEGYVRSILDEGAVVEGLLRKAIVQDIEPSYAGKLLTALDGEPFLSLAQAVHKTELLDPLSQREKEVLHLLFTDLSVPEIAQALVVSASTVRSHIKNIYSKLDVHSRHEAVTKARELEILF